jgi:hypothetical protein
MAPARLILLLQQCGFDSTATRRQPSGPLPAAHLQAVEQHPQQLVAVVLLPPLELRRVAADRGQQRLRVVAGGVAAVAALGTAWGGVGAGRPHPGRR